LVYIWQASTKLSKLVRLVSAKALSWREANS
jgi:hypothetical protein